MESIEIIRQTIWKDNDATNMARILFNGANVVQANVGSIVRTTYDLSGSTPTTATDTTTLTVASVVLDDLQTDGRWTKDSRGYNLRDRMAGALFPAGGHKYAVRYQFRGAGGELFPVEFELTAQKVFGS